MNAHSDPHRGLAIDLELLVQLLQSGLDFLRCFDGCCGFGLNVLFNGHSEDGEHAVTGEFVHHPTASGHSGNTDFHPSIQPIHEFTGTEPFRNAREVGGVCEQHGDR